jgi:WD40 repeat protein
LKTLYCPGYNPSGVHTVAFDSTYLLASGSSDNTVKLWDKKNDQLRSLTGHNGEIYEVAFDSNGLLASGSADRTIKLRDKNSGNLLRTLTGHDDGVLSVAFDSTYLLSVVLLTGLSRFGTRTLGICCGL